MRGEVDNGLRDVLFAGLSQPLSNRYLKPLSLIYILRMNAELTWAGMRGR